MKEVLLNENLNSSIVALISLDKASAFIIMFQLGDCHHTVQSVTLKHMTRFTKLIVSELKSNVQHTIDPMI